MNQWRLFLLFGWLKPRKARPIAAGELLADGDGALLTDENGNTLTG